MKWPLLTDRPFAAHTAESFYAYIKSLMKSNTSKEVSGVSIAIGKKDKLTIRISREEKIVTRQELHLLAQEYKQDEFQLLQLFMKRKIGINYDDDNTRRESDSIALAAAKENVKNLRLALRKEKSGDKLLKPKRNSRLHEESSILPTEEPTS